MGSHHLMIVSKALLIVGEKPLTNTNAHKNTPEDDKANEGDRDGGRGQSLSEGCKYNDDQFESIHAFTSDHVCEIPKSELADYRPT